MDWISTLNQYAPSLIGQFNQQANSRMAAQEARQWEEDMYNKYNSPSALVRQYQEAGINPALMFGGQTPAAPTDTVAAETAPNAIGNVTEMIAQTLNLESLKYDIEIKKWQAKDYESQVLRREFQNALDEAQTNTVLKNYEWIDRVNEAKTSADKASAARDFAEAAISQEEKRLGHRLGTSELLAVATAITSALGIHATDDGLLDAIIDEVFGDSIPDDLTPFEALGGPIAGGLIRRLRQRKGKK